MLISDLYDYCDSNIAVNGAIGIISPSANDNNKAEKGFTFKSKASFTSWISKVNNTKKIQTTAIWLSKCVICWTIMKIVLWHQKSFRTIVKTKWMAIMYMTFECKTNIKKKISERPKQSGYAGDANQPPRPPEPTLDIDIIIPL